MYGNNITQVGDQLLTISIEKTFQAIVNPKQEYQDLMQQLQTLCSVDKTQYAIIKKKLPYIVCGKFHPAYRKKENFAAIHSFILDMDHVTSSGRNIDALCLKLKNDPEVKLLFKSPSGDGIKLLFIIEDECKDSSLFSAFYKLFAMKFAEKHEVVDLVDFKTNDVTRACFLSYDKDAYFNPLSIPVNIADYITEFDFEKSEREIKNNELKIKETTIPTISSNNLNSEILAAIKQKLNPGAVSIPKSVLVPEQIDKAIPIIKEQLLAYNIELVKTSAINYGNKLTVKAGHLWAEINIFYGKRGYSVVQTTKTNSSSQLAELASEAIRSIINQNYLP